MLDCAERYGFVVRYATDEDRELAEHSDTSNVTLNVCLGREFIGGSLYFKGCAWLWKEERCGGGGSTGQQ